MEKKTIDLKNKAKRILKSIKTKGISYCITKEVNLLNDCHYEEHIFYVKAKDYFLVQRIDWEKFPLGGVKGSNQFSKETEEDLLDLIEMKLEDELVK